MTKLYFENELGRVDINGGRWRLTQADGLGMPSPQFAVTTYVGEDGQHTLSSSFGARTITLGGDIRRVASDRMRDTITEELRRAIRVFSRKGVLYLRTGRLGSYAKRAIPCRCTSFETPTRNGGFQLFVLQFVADTPYFSDWVDSEKALFKREDLLTPTFFLPSTGIIFTKRISQTMILNEGDVRTEPVIRLVCTGEGSAEPSRIAVQNMTLDQKVVLHCPMRKGETITIDFGRRTIETNMPDESNYNGNLLLCLDEGYHLSGFWLQPGENEIKMECSEQAYAVCVVRNQYLEAVY